MRQYPHILTYESGVSAPPYIDDNGDWQYPEGTVTTVSEVCRMEPPATGGNGGQNTVLGKYGEYVSYAFMVYMPLSTVDILEGVEVQIWDAGQVIGTGSIKQFHKTRLNATLWI